MVEVLHRQQEDCKHLLNNYMTDEHYDHVVTTDTDLYNGYTEDETYLGFRFRKNVFSQEEITSAYEGLADAATSTNNRGTSTGTIGDARQGNRDWVYPWQLEIMDRIENSSDNPLAAMLGEDKFDPQTVMDAYVKKNGSLDYHDDVRGVLWHRSRIAEVGIPYENFFMNELPNLTPDRVREIRKFITTTSYTASILSGIAGFYNRYPRIPFGRATRYTEENMDKFKLCYPYMRTLNKLFKDLVPERYAHQKAVADRIDKRFVVAEDTAFSTITVNKNYRTTAHVDGANHPGGFSNLSTVTKDGKAGWSGGLFVLPEFRVAIDLKPGDALLVDNCGIIHGNTEIKPPAGMDVEDMERISLVSYMREDMTMLGSWEYEQARKDYVTLRRQGATEEQKKAKFNGITPGMFDTPEFDEFCDQREIAKEDRGRKRGS